MMRIGSGIRLTSVFSKTEKNLNYLLLFYTGLNLTVRHDSCFNPTIYSYLLIPNHRSDRQSYEHRTTVLFESRCGICNFLASSLTRRLFLSSPLSVCNFFIFSVFSYSIRFGGGEGGGLF